MQIIFDIIDYFSFSFEIMLAALFFASYFGMRKKGKIRFFIGVAIMCIIGSFWNPSYEPSSFLAHTAKYTTLFGVCGLTIFASYNCDIWSSLFSATIGYSVQHMTYNFFSLWMNLLRLNNSNIRYLLHVFWFLLVYSSLYFFGKRRYKDDRDSMQQRFVANWNIILFSAAFLLIATLLDNVTFSVIYGNGAAVVMPLIYVYLTIIAAAVLYILLNILRINKTENDLRNMKLLLHAQHRVYRNNKEMIETVNLKAHDLKHQIHMLGGSIPEMQVKEMEQLVNMYDTSLHTGNDALDIVLAEKGMQCVNRGIRFTCLLDGEHLRNFSDADIYSFFGNAIDNAIDAVTKLPEEKRIISITENVQGNFLNISIENYCGEDPIEFEYGMPVSSRDSRYHGFGTKSMKLIAEKYSGNLFFDKSGDMFTVNLILPLNTFEQ